MFFNIKLFIIELNNYLVWYQSSIFINKKVLPRRFKKKKYSQEI
jgi:hypothetical protein